MREVKFRVSAPSFAQETNKFDIRWDDVLFPKQDLWVSSEELHHFSWGSNSHLLLRGKHHERSQRKPRLSYFYTHLPYLWPKSRLFRRFVLVKLPLKGSHHSHFLRVQENHAEVWQYSTVTCHKPGYLFALWGLSVCVCVTLKETTRGHS